MLIEPFTLGFGRVVPTVVIAGKHSFHLPLCLAAQVQALEASHFACAVPSIQINGFGFGEVPSAILGSCVTPGLCPSTKYCPHCAMRSDTAPARFSRLHRGQGRPPGFRSPCSM